MQSPEIILLRLIHVLAGIFWVGTAAFNTWFLMPALASTGPAAGQVMAALQQRRLLTILPLSAILTILSGFRLIWIMSGGFEAAYFATAPGATYATAGALATVAFVVGMIVIRPTMARAAQLGASMPNLSESERAAAGAEMTRLRKRGATGSALVTVALIFAAAGMGVARYLG